MRASCVAAALFAVLASSASGAAESALKNPHQGDAARAEQGRSLFNQYCSHCHAPNAETADRVRDVRRLRLRYEDRMTEVFWKTVHDGRVERGMPSWKGVLDDDTLWTIYTFIQTVQK